MQRLLLTAASFGLLLACDQPSRVQLQTTALNVVRFEQTRYVAPARKAPTRRRRSRPRVATTPKKPVVEPAIDWSTAVEVDSGYEETLPEMLSESSFLRTVDSWSGVRNCVRSARATSGGALRVAFDIERTGSVRAARTIDTSNALASVIAPCVERKARLLKFPPFERDEGVERIAKFVF